MLESTTTLNTVPIDEKMKDPSSDLSAFPDTRAIARGSITESEISSLFDLQIDVERSSLTNKVQ